MANIICANGMCKYNKNHTCTKKEISLSLGHYKTIESGNVVRLVICCEENRDEKDLWI